jgi:uncharacterized protein (DUF488 family)
MIYSLGHSTLSERDFAEACHVAGVKIIFDVRSHPGSAANPQFNQKTMAGWLRDVGIGYEWWPALGGWEETYVGHVRSVEYGRYDVDVMAYCHNAFPKQRINKKTPEGYGFTNYGFYDYQFFQTIEEYRLSIRRLTERVADNGAMVCCEARWPQCHRTMLADHLGFLGIDVVHLEPRFRKIKQPRTVVKETSHERFLVERLQRYHKFVIETWKRWRDGDE